MDIERIARGLLRELRGRRSQVQWSRRLGYRSNVAYAWESGRRWPTAAETLRAAGRSGVDVEDALERFYGARPAFLGRDPTSAATAAALLDDLRGTAPIAELARRAGCTRFQLTRWLSGETQPRLPDFLRVVDAASLRLADFVACFVDPERIAALAPAWRALVARREGAAKLPWTQAVMRGLELAAYRALPRHEVGWLAAWLGVAVEVEVEALAFLVDTDQVLFDGLHYAPRVATLDTRLSPAVGRALKAHWARVAADRVEDGAPGQFSYNVFAVSAADLERIRELHLGYFRAMRAIVAESRPAEVVAVVNVQLFALGPGEATPDADRARR